MLKAAFGRLFYVYPLRQEKPRMHDTAETQTAQGAYFMQIVLPVDGSSFTTRAAQVLVQQVRQYAAPPQIVLFTVARPIGTPLARAQLSKAALDTYYSDVSAQALAPAEAVLRDAGLTFAAHHAVGDPAEQIAAEIKRLQPDLVIMGTHGHSALKGFVMGSVASKVVASTTVPVLLVR